MNSIIVRSDLSITVSPDAETLKASALQTAALVGKVTNAAEQETAVAAQRELRRVIKLCEDSRVEVKAPILAAGKAVDAIAARFREEVAEEELRIVTLVADFQVLEAAKVRAAEAVKRLEEEKLERERLAELARIEAERKVEQAKLDAEAARIAAQAREATSKKARAEAQTAQLELERQQALAAASTLAQLDAANERHCEAVAALPTVTAARAEGQVVKWDWEISVSDVWALARCHPMCVKVEPRLTEIKSLLDNGVKVAGITAKKVPKSSVRTSPERMAIEI